MKRYNSLKTLSLPEIVYLSILWRNNKGKKKVLKNLQGIFFFFLKAPLPLFCNGCGCEIIRLKNTGGVLRVEFDWQDFLKAVNKPNSLRERNRGGRFHHTMGKTVSSWIIDTAQNTVVHFLFFFFLISVSASWNKTFQLAQFMKAICTCSQNSLKKKNLQEGF